MFTSAEAHDDLQQRLLAAIYREAGHGELILKGGVAMRVRAGSARYTRDLDFDHDPHRSLSSLQHTIRRAITQAANGAHLQGLTVTEPKQTGEVARWKIHATTREGFPVGLVIEVSRRAPLNLAGAPAMPFQPSNRTIPRVLVDVYSEAQLLAMKLGALLDPNRVAPRDLYDLDVLLARGAVIEAGHPYDASLVWTKLEAMTWPHFLAEVVPTLPQAEQARFDEEQFLSMKLRVGEALT